MLAPTSSKDCRVHTPCAVCEQPFFPPTSFIRHCSPKCGIKLLALKAKAERESTKARKEALKPRKDWMAEAKVAIQKARRLEELSKGRGCMSCLRTQQEVEQTDGWKPGGAWDGGHFQSKGARPELALEPLNIWLQCKSCNGGSGKYARKAYTVNLAFEENLIAAEGQALVDWLKGPHDPKKYTIPDLKQIIATYRAKAKELEQ